MFFLFLYLTRADSSSTTTNCTIPNTIPKRGKCVCSPSFFGDDPVTERGCWKCAPECHKYAKCFFPGKCICSHSLLGDGVTECSPPIPQLSSFTIIKNTYFQTLRIYANYVPLIFHPLFAFCKFGTNLSHGLVYHNSSVSCLIPNEVSSPISFSISFDAIHFSIPKEISFENISQQISIHLPNYGFIKQNKKKISTQSSKIPFIHPKNLVFFYVITIIELLFLIFYSLSLFLRRRNKLVHIQESDVINNSPKLYENDFNNGNELRKRVL